MAGCRRRMRVLVCGTAPPAVALAGALQWAGHRVTLTSHGRPPTELEAAGVGWAESEVGEGGSAAALTDGVDAVVVAPEVEGVRNPQARAAHDLC